MKTGSRESPGGHSRTDTAIILHPVLPGSRKDRHERQKLEEAIALAGAINLEVVESKTVKITKINSSTLLGKGAVEIAEEDIGKISLSVVVINASLSPVQQRNLENIWKVKVIDRTGLILEIFGERAQTREGTLQVELAQLEYQRSRLVRSWTHLERQRGGAGFMGGPGETQLEIDRRIITDRIAKLKKDIEKVRKTRALARRSREQVPFPVVALVGYTNAGKSSLFNQMTGAAVYAEDLPFATLDPTARRLDLSGGDPVILSDTVGFITDLPTHLIAAFRATLEQINYADLILHVRDISCRDSLAQKADVISVLNDLGIEYESDSRIIEVLNKIDIADEDALSEAKRKEKVEKNIPVSALTGEGVAELVDEISRITSENKKAVEYNIDVSDGKALSWLYNHAEIIERNDRKETINLRLKMDTVNIRRFEDKFSYNSEHKQMKQ
jgi:GTP-binding protein HflX